MKRLLLPDNVIYAGGPRARLSRTSPGFAARLKMQARPKCVSDEPEGLFHMVLCPFYGYRWPDNTPRLRRGCDDECGLDFDENGPCAMESGGDVPDYFRCPLAKQMRAALRAGRWHITFEGTNGRSETLEDWLQKLNR